MNPSKSGKLSIFKIYQVTFQLLRKHPAFFIPFIIFALFDALALIILFLAPRMPLILVLGPFIRTFWGEGFLHYPTNFLLLPKLFFLNRMVLSVIAGSLLSGIAVDIILGIYNEKPVRLRESFKTALRKYISLFTVVFLISLLYYFLTKISSISLTKYFFDPKKRVLIFKFESHHGSGFNPGKLIARGLYPVDFCLCYPGIDDRKRETYPGNFQIGFDFQKGISPHDYFGGPAVASLYPYLCLKL